MKQRLFYSMVLILYVLGVQATIIGVDTLLVWVPPKNGELFDDEDYIEVDCIPVYGYTDQPEFDF